MLDQTFGVEFECFLPAGTSHHMAAQALIAAGVQTFAEGYNHITRNHWKVVTDGSLGDYARGAEIVSPVLTGQAGLDEVRKVCTALTAIGCTINRRCGFHVHVGARNRDLAFFKRLIATYAHFEQVADGFMPASRAANVYCQSIRGNLQAVERATSITGVLQAFRGRYWKLNVQSFTVHGTVEFRHHSGTVDPEKAVNWVLLVLALCHKAGEPRATGTPEPIVYRGKRVTIASWPDSYRMLQLMLRPEGATEDELRRLSGLSKPQPAFRCRLFGYQCVKVRNGAFRAVAPAGTVAASADVMPEATVDGLMSFTGLNGDVATYFAARTTHFATRRERAA